MKNSVNPVLAAVLVAVVVVLAAGIYMVAGNREQKAPQIQSGPIKLPPSQVGTKLGGQTLGNEGPGTQSSAPK